MDLDFISSEERSTPEKVQEYSYSYKIYYRNSSNKINSKKQKPESIIFLYGKENLNYHEVVEFLMKKYNIAWIQKIECNDV
jgi:hypothetical protein